MSKNKNKTQETFQKAKNVCFLAFLLFLFSWMCLPAKASDITADKVVELVNKARVEAGASPLVINARLKIAAQNKADDMFAREYFAHIAPDGKTPWDFITQAGYDYRYAGENLAIDFVSAKEQQNAWMESPLHRKNILNPEFQDIGVAVKKGELNGKETIVTVQEFGAIAPVPSTGDSAKKDTIAAAQQVKPKENAAGIVANTFKKETIQDSAKNWKDKLQGPILENGKLTFFGWCMAAILALLMVIIDLIFLAFRSRQEEINL